MLELACPVRIPKQNRSADWNGPGIFGECFCNTSLFANDQLHVKLSLLISNSVSNQVKPTTEPLSPDRHLLNFLTSHQCATDRKKMNYCCSARLSNLLICFIIYFDYFLLKAFSARNLKDSVDF